MYLVFTRMPGESYRRRLGALLAYLCDVFRAQINSHECYALHSYVGTVVDNVMPYVATWRQLLIMLCAA